MKDNERRQLIKYLLAGSAAYPLSVSASLFDKNKPAPKKQIHHWSGTVKINGQSLRPKTIIKPGDTIETGSTSELVFTLGQDAYLLRNNTKMMLHNNSGIVQTLRIISGAILSVFGSGNKTILTPAATIGIRGTGTYYEVSDNETYFCTCYGATDIASSQDPSVSESVSSTHHESPRLIRNTKQGAIIEKAPMRNHSDTELIMLESTVGREPPFVDDIFGDDSYGGY